MHTATHPQSSSSALRGRMGRGALVLGAHVAIIYGVAATSAWTTVRVRFRLDA